MVEGSSGGGVVGEAAGIAATEVGETSWRGIATASASALAGDGTYVERAATFFVSVGFTRVSRAF